MYRIAEFRKISRERYLKDASEVTDEAVASAAFDKIIMPARATRGSAGYDFHAPYAFALEPGETVKIPTGIRAVMDDGWVLMLYPRSGLGYKYRVMLNNTTGIIDSDYCYSDNEGHIFIKLYNGGDKRMEVDEGAAFVQGVFLPYGITRDDDATATRNGGFGSTSRK